MAIVGHGLVGLAIGGTASSKTRGGRLPYAWLGVTVLLAYAVDVVEWTALLFDPDLVNSHFVTHSPSRVLGLGLGACLVIWAGWRIRHPWPYVVVTGVVSSHLALDHTAVRDAIEGWYSEELLEAHTFRPAMLTAEMCVYGAPLVWILLLRAAVEPDTSRRARAVCGALVVVSFLSALTCRAAVWTPVYILSAVLALVLLRQHLGVRVLWMAVPMLPVLAIATATVLGVVRAERAKALASEDRHAEAVAAFQSALDVPSRIGRTHAYCGMGESYEHLRLLTHAEGAYRQAVALSSRPGLAALHLARFYTRHPGTPFHRPDEAARILHALLDVPTACRAHHTTARIWLRRLRSHNVVPPPGTRPTPASRDNNREVRGGG
jgi:hypothetical protein